jgi:methylmalonyl-CoA/ethylmalonyl-CoA epimerase
MTTSRDVGKHKAAILDHVAIGTRALADGWDLFGGVLGGTWVYGGDSAGFWWGQLQFRTGPKIELLTPTGGPDAAFLERFLDSHGPGPHHLNFIVPDINAALARVRAAGIEPVGVNIESPTWKEAFLHPRNAYGIVVQVAEQSGPPPALAPPEALPPAGPPSGLIVVEHQVADIDGAIRLFAGVLDGEVVSGPQAGEAPVAELTWDNGARLRLSGPGLGTDGARRGHEGLSYLRFTREGASFTESDRAQAAELSRRLGISLQLGD